MPKGLVWAALAAAVWATGSTLLAADPAESPGSARLVRKVYAVGDLVVATPQRPPELPPLGRSRPVPSAAACDVAQACATVPAVTPACCPDGSPCRAACAPAVAQACATIPTRPVRDAAPLVKMLTSMVRPYSWQEMGGPGRVEFHETGCSLVVEHTASVQAEVAGLLAALRRLQRAQVGEVALEVRLVEVGEGFCERCGIELPGDKPAVFLSDAQVCQLLEAVQGDRRTRVLAAPKLVCRDMEPGWFQVGGPHVYQAGLDLEAGPNGVVRKPRFQAVDLGLRVVATPAISADRRFVRLKFRCEEATLGGGGPVTPVSVGNEPGKPAELLSIPVVDCQVLETCVTIPAGKTALLAGPVATRQVRVETAAPVLSEVPGLDRMFRNVAIGRETCRRLVLVTPRVIVPKECAPPAAVGCPACPQCPGCPTCPDCPASGCSECEAAKLVKAYRAACAAGRTEEAMRLAMQALAKDPKCFAAEK